MDITNLYLLLDYISFQKEDINIYFNYLKYMYFNVLESSMSILLSQAGIQFYFSTLQSSFQVH